MQDTYIEKNHVFFDPNIKYNGLLKTLRKNKIIKEIVGTIYYNYQVVPIGILNMGILKTFDYNGVMKYKELINGENNE